MVIRVLVAHSSPLMRAGIRSALESRQVEVVGETSRTEEVLPAVEATCPDVALMDGELGGTLDPLEVVRQVRAPGATSVLVLSRARDPGLMGRMRAAGAAGWVSGGGLPKGHPGRGGGGTGAGAVDTEAARGAGGLAARGRL